jgi:hypothetical protein
VNNKLGSRVDIEYGVVEVIYRITRVRNPLPLYLIFVLNLNFYLIVRCPFLQSKKRKPCKYGRTIRMTRLNGAVVGMLYSLWNVVLMKAISE